MNKIYVTILLIIITIIGYLLYNKLAFLSIIVKFDELEPFERKMNVYYKGFKVGETTKIFPDKNYKNTYLRLKLFPHDIKLPNNIIAKINKTNKKEYISLIYPDAPSIKEIKNDDEIKGCISKDLQSILKNSINEDDVDIILDETSSLIENANATIQSLNSIFQELNSIIIDSKSDIKEAIRNLAKITKNLEETTGKLNKSIKEDDLNSSLNNIYKTTNEIKETTENINNITKQIDKVTMPIVNSIACDTKEISNGVKRTLKKRLGLMKLLVGKPIKEKCN